MKRYITRPRSARFHDDDSTLDAEHYLARTVFEPDPEPVYTGLLDAQGNDLYSVIEMQPVGFVRFKS